MLKLCTALVLFLTVACQVTPVLAQTCTTHTYFYGTKMVLCTTCCYPYSGCTTTCF